ncbi:cation channel family protein [Reticulomyxa filosa]|uniref:Cation channel family protein n=1 Tax=Reticulomyxa filosa TaxID=46433 RepID=X6NJY0_RETFI|nr:cation channel family protein [Reticulomyxa filosa]|eukprot:ETO26029.1 cation channel family protein [Reticulomyxa filosa]
MFLFALPSLWNIAVTVLIIFYIFSIVGVNLFGHVDSGLERYNFRDFPHAIYTLFLCSTGESWWVMLGKCMSQTNQYIAVLYWLLFFLVGGLVSMNLFIGVILDTFSENLKAEKEHELQLMSVSRFVEAWNEEDPSAMGILPVHKFWRLMLRTPFPSGFTQPLPNDEAELTDEAYQRFTNIIKSGVYKEPNVIEAKEHIAKIKLICQKGIKVGIGKHAEYRFLSQEQEDIYTIGNKILQFFIDLCNEEEHDHNQEFHHSDEPTQKKKMAASSSALSVESENEDTDKGVWLVEFKDAIIALCTSVTGPELSVRVNNPRYEMTFIDWWEKYESENFSKNVAGSEGALGAQSMLSFVDQWLEKKTTK